MMGGNSEDDFELAMLRQAALNSLQRNRANKGPSGNGSSRKLPPNLQHRPLPNNRNLIEIQTQSDLLQSDLDSGLMEEIVVAEGIDMDDSDCDEIIEEVIMSEGDESSSRSNSPTTKCGSLSPTVEQEGTTIEQEVVDSSSDDDALSVCSRYSLYEEDLLEDDPTTRLPTLRVRVPPSITISTNDAKDGRVNQRRRSRSPPHHPRSRSRSRDRLRPTMIRNSRSRSPLPPRRRPRMRSRSRSPVGRRRPTSRRSRSRDRGDFRSGRRSSSRERDLQSSRVMDNNSWDKSKRVKEEPPRRPARSPPTRRDYVPSSRRIRSRSRSLSREKRNIHDRGVNTRDKDQVRDSKKQKESSDLTELKTNKSSSSPEARGAPPLVPGVDQEVLEKRRRKFQEKQPLTVEGNQGKKIRLQSSNNRGGDERDRRSRSPENRSSNRKVQTLPRSQQDDDRNSSRSPQNHIPTTISLQSTKQQRHPTSRSTKDRDRDPSSPSPTNIKVNVEPDSESEQEDLRAKLIKKKMKAQQQGHHLAPGRIFSEALKGTRLTTSNSSTTSTTSTTKSSRISSSRSSSISSSKTKPNQKRKVSLTYA